MEACIVEGQQGQLNGGKRKEVDYYIGKPHKPSLFNKEKKDNTISQSRSVAGFYQSTSRGSTSGQSNFKGNSAGGVLKQKTITYPLYVRCEQGHPRDCYDFNL